MFGCMFPYEGVGSTSNTRRRKQIRQSLKKSVTIDPLRWRQEVFVREPFQKDFELVWQGRYYSGLLENIYR